MGEEVVSQLRVTVSPVPTVSLDGVIVGFCGGSEERRTCHYDVTVWETPCGIMQFQIAITTYSLLVCFVLFFIHILASF